VTYSANYTEHAELKRTIPMFISQIDKRQKQLEPHSEKDDMKNQKFIENLERLYTHIHVHSMEEAREVPNTRIMLGFAAKIIESVQAA
jgi:hypothetical protein